MLVQGLPPEADYRFKYALIQDAAYENLLKSRRQVLHRRVAEMLRVAAGAAAEPELLAHHFAQAGLTEDADGRRRPKSLRSPDGSLPAGPWRAPPRQCGQRLLHRKNLTRSRNKMLQCEIAL
jgi:predicted ATPase